mgnify:CR=1 FL=1
MALTKDTKAPTFTLKRKTAEGLEEVSLSNNFGEKQTVLLFFPLAFTSVCKNELCSVSEGLEAFRDLDAVVWGISVDSPFAQSAGIGIPLLSDFNKEVATAYDVLYADLLGLRGVAKRSAFVINKEGIITYSWSSDDPKQLPDFDEIQAALK